VAFYPKRYSIAAGSSHPVELKHNEQMSNQSNHLPRQIRTRTTTTETKNNRISIIFNKNIHITQKIPKNT
jgi:hypothetical protein